MLYRGSWLPMRTSWFVILTVAVIRFGAGQAIGVDTLSVTLREAADDYYQGEYRKTVLRLENNIALYHDGALLEAHKYLAFSYARLGQGERAGKQFRMIFRLDPRWKMDPKDSAPEIDPILIATRKDIAQEAGMCSCFIPGIGQIMKGEQKKGLILLSGTSAALAVSIACWVVTDNRRQDYLAIGLNDTLRMNEAYGRYNNWYRLSLASTAVLLGVYIYGICDAFIPGSDYFSAQASHEQGFVWSLGRAGGRLGYEIRF